MRLTPEELEKAKRAAKRHHCPGDGKGKHTLQKAVIGGTTMGHRCIKCGFEIQPKQPAKS